MPKTSARLSPRRRPGYQALALATWFILPAGCAHLGPAERQALIQANEMYARDQTSAAVARLDRLISDFDQAPEIAEAYYLRGLCRTRKGELQAAREDFKRAIDRSKRADLTARCRASLAAIAFREGDWLEAANLYEEALDGLPVQPPSDEIRFSAGVAAQRAGRWKDAAIHFARLLREFRDRPLAADARRMAAWRHEYFAIQLGAYQDAANAEKTVSTYKARGLPQVVVQHLPRGGQSLWVVMAGQYATYSKALAALPRVRGVEPNAHIIPQP